MAPVPRRPSGNDQRRAIEAIARIHDNTRRQSAPQPGSPGPARPGPTRTGRGDTGWQPGPAVANPPTSSPRPLLQSLPRSFRPLPNLERPRSGHRVLVAAIGLTLLGLVAAVATAGGGSHPAATGSGSGSGASASTSAPSTLRSTARATRSPRTSSGRSSRTRSQTKSSSPGSAGPLQPSSTGPGTASYVVSGASSVSVVLAASGGPCWAEASPQPGGAVSWEGTIAAGQSHQLAPGTSWWIRLGAPVEVTVTANGRPLALPGTGDQPVDVTITAS